MHYNTLKSTKVRLSAIFALVVFLISLSLAIVFLSYKYLTIGRAERINFILSNEKIIHLIDHNSGVLEDLSKKKSGLRRIPANHKSGIPAGEESLYKNFLILENSTNEVRFWNINKNFNVEALIGKALPSGFSFHNGTMIYTAPLEHIYRGNSIIFLQERQYDPTEYFLDLFRFLILSFISSIAFYFIGFNFVSRNLKPVEENINDMENFIHNAGHEFKTPLSVIHSNLQLLHEIKEYDKKLTSESIEEIIKLDKLIEGLMRLSNIKVEQKTQLLELTPQIQRVLDDFSQEAKSKGIKINFNIQHNTHVKAHSEYFYILFSNLVGNAIKYNTTQGSIDICLDKNKLSLSDTGIGFSKDIQKKIFDRFYKGSEARNTDGYGIGLSLVKKIALMYKWKIEVQSEPGKGSTFTILFH